MKPLPLLLALALGSSVTGHALSQEPNAHASASKEALIVHMKNMLFVPAQATINRGDTVTFVNDDDVPHTVTAEDKSFDSGNIAAHATWKHTFTKDGTQSYVCVYHLPNMKGRLTVTATTPEGVNPVPQATATHRLFAKTRFKAGGRIVTVYMRGGRFSPEVKKIHLGDRVFFVNKDDIAHTVTASDKSFNSMEVAPHRSWSHRFARLGNYPYRCMYHLPYMKGRIIVYAGLSKETS